MAVSYSVRIAFASNPFDVTPTWVDVSSDLMSFHIRRGRQWELNRMEPGTCTLRLRNLHGDYWPTNTTGSYYPNVLPWKRINIQGTFAIREDYYLSDTTSLTVFGVNWQAQTFTPSVNYNITSVKLKLFRVGSPGTVTVSIRATDGSGHPTGADLTSGTTDGNTLTTSSSGELREISLTLLALTSGTKYSIVARATAGDGSNYLNWALNTAGTYASGNEENSSDSGGTWGTNPTYDLVFETYQSTTYDLYTGYIESWQPDFILRPVKAPIMDLACSDGIKNLSLFTLTSTTTYASEQSGTRIANVLDSVGWPTSTRLLDAGQSSLQSTGAMTDVNAMTHLYTVEDTELGILYMTPSGSMRFEDRHTRLLSPYTTSQATFGDVASTDKPYSGILLAHEDLRIYNDLRVTATAGTEQRATNTTSADTYGPRALLRPSLLMVTDAEALAQAQYLLARYQTPVMRCKQIEVKANANPAVLYPLVLGYDISTRLTIKLNQASLNKDYHIEGINHDWDVQDASGLKTTWMLSDASVETSWILGTSALGVDTTLVY